MEEVAPEMGLKAQRWGFQAERRKPVRPGWDGWSVEEVEQGLWCAGGQAEAPL